MRLLAILICSIGLFVNASLVSSATITVTTTEPGVNADGSCSFAEAVDNVREGNVHADCVVGETTGNTIELGEGLTYLASRAEYDTGTFPLMILGNSSILEDMKLLTAGPDVTIRDLITFNSEIWWSAGESASSPTGFLKVERCEFEGGFLLYIRVDDDAESADVEIADTVFRGGGGTFGVFIADSSSMENLYRFVDCDFLKTGYGIWFHADSGLLDVDGCLFDNNEIGIVAGGAAVEVSRSSFIDSYDGIDVISRDSGIQSSLVVMSCTFNSNGSGIRVSEPDGPSPGSIRIKHSTFVQNGYSLGGWLDAISIESTILTTRGDIYSQNCDYYSHPETSPSSSGFNIADDAACNLDHHTDMVVDEMMMSELGDYGGKTPVHTPLEGSPVIDMGDADCPRRDQRGYKRPTDGNEDGVAVCDCGAVEYNSVPLPTPYEHEAVAAVDE